MSDIERRKRDHIDIVMSGVARHNAPAGFDDVRFEHNALPEIDLDSIDLGTRFLGKTLRLPYLASSMTGGPDISDRINRAILGLRVDGAPIDFGALSTVTCHWT